MATIPPRAFSVQETRDLIAGLCPSLEPETMPLDRAVGRVLAEDAAAPEDLPPFDRSAVDGYAVRTDDTGSSFVVTDEIRAGQWKPQSLERGHCVAIGTGAALPGTGLRVIMKEDVERSGDRIRLLRTSMASGVRFRGEDAPKGSIMIRRGQRINHGSASLLASIGLSEPRVVRLPIVTHFVTGDELVPPDQLPAPGQVRDANSILVAAFLAAFGVKVRQQSLPEHEDSLTTAISEALALGSDLILVSGGASVGERDFSRSALEACGLTICIQQTTTRPGKPLIVARRSTNELTTLAIGLPGNPLSHYVCLHLYVRRALEGLAGLTRPAEFQAGFLTQPFSPKAHPRETLWPAQCLMDQGRARLSPLPWTSSGDLKTLALANALIYLPPATVNLPAEQPVQYFSTELNI